MNQTLPPIDDERMIVRAHHEYARALDRRDWRALDRVFAPDCEARYGENAVNMGREAIVAGIRAYLDGCGPTQHLMGNITVDVVDADTLSSSAAVRAAHRAKNGPELFWSIASYLARWSRTKEGWRATQWTMRVDFNHGDPAVFGG